MTEFVLKNEGDVRSIMVHNLPVWLKGDQDRVDDMVQEFYYHMVRYKTLEAYDKSRATEGKDEQKAYETWIYTAIKNFMANIKKSKARKTEALFQVKDPQAQADSDQKRLSEEDDLKACLASSDEGEFMALQRDLIRRILGSTEESHHTKQRMARIIRLSAKGWKGRELAKHEGVSGTYISSLKKRAKQYYREVVGSSSYTGIHKALTD